jgi:Ca2+-transporting ATPase
MARTWSGGAVSEPQWHELPGDQVAERLETRPAWGLSPEQAAERLLRQGPNALPEKKRRSSILVFLNQFRSPLIYLLFAAAGVALAIGETRDALVIVGVVFVNAVIGAFQEGRAEHSMQALRRMSALRVRVLRGGEERSLEARLLVPGDVLLLAAGDAIGADARLVEAACLELSEAVLTGESQAVAKDVRPLPADTPLADRRNMVYAATHVATGRGRAVVTATGPGTEVGRIAELAESVEDDRTPLERRIAQFGRSLAVAALGVFAVVLSAGLVRGLSWSQILMVAISQLVSTVPEGLPVAMTVALAMGMRRMAERRAIVRRLAAVESLGSTTVICTDKTGTLTRNEMTATAIELPQDRRIQVTGTGYAPEGRLLEHGRDVAARGDPGLRAVLEAAALCNDARLVPPEATGGPWRAVGDPTEAALLALAAKGGIDATELRASLPRCGEIPFSAEAKLMATEHGGTAGARVLLKGAAEMVLELCGSVRLGAEAAPLDDQARRALATAAEAMAGRALRVLAFAEAHDVRLDEKGGFGSLRGRASFLGLVGEEDPPREEAREAVSLCQAAGIRVVMVTGDHQATGLAVARTLGIVRPGDVAVDGRTLDAMDDAQFQGELSRISVFARVQPAQKLRIVEALQEGGDVVDHDRRRRERRPRPGSRRRRDRPGHDRHGGGQGGRRDRRHRRQLRHHGPGRARGTRRLPEPQEGGAAAPVDGARRDRRPGAGRALRLSAPVRGGPDSLEQRGHRGHHHRQLRHGAAGGGRDAQPAHSA